MTWHYWMGGQFWAGWWNSSSTFFVDVCGLELEGDLADRCHAYAATIESGCYWWPNSDFVMYCERPVEIHRDEFGRLHSETGMAIHWPDGWGLWMWHGVKVPREVIESPSTITIERIQAESNAEVQRIMIERLGPGEYLHKSGATLVDMDSLTLVGSAPRALMRDKFGNQWLVGTDGSTARVYHMSVPPDVKTCREAHEAICGFDESRIICEA